MNNNLIKSIVVVSVILMIVALYSFFMLSTPAKTLAGTDNIQDRAQVGGDFILTDQFGNKFDSNSMIGKINLVYFGFTFCPDVCPATMQVLTAVLDNLRKYNIDINTIFITVDPSRDSPENLRKFLSHFDAKIVGLTGTEEEIRVVADTYKAYYAIEPNSGTNKNDYLVNHSSFIYVMDRGGKYLTHFGAQSTPEEITEYIRVNK